jgi:hypothetical protein
VSTVLVLLVYPRKERISKQENAHVLEAGAYHGAVVMIFVGMPCAYGRVKTLTDASAQNCRDLLLWEKVTRDLLLWEKSHTIVFYFGI